METLDFCVTFRIMKLLKGKLLKVIKLNYEIKILNIIEIKL